MIMIIIIILFTNYSCSSGAHNVWHSRTIDKIGPTTQYTYTVCADSRYCFLGAAGGSDRRRDVCARTVQRSSSSDFRPWSDGDRRMNGRPYGRDANGSADEWPAAGGRTVRPGFHTYCACVLPPLHRSVSANEVPPRWRRTNKGALVTIHTRDSWEYDN